MAEQSGKDRRLEPRHGFALHVSYGDRGRFLGDWTENVSTGGLFVRTEEPFRIGDPVRLRLSFPGLLDAVEVEGLVAWIRPAAGETPRGVGVRVEGEADRRRLTELALLAARQAETPARDYAVLVVEDNPHMGRVYERVLKRIADSSGHRIGLRLAANGHEALRELASRPADLLLTDLYMPVMDGFALIEEVRKQSKLERMAILVATAADDDEYERLSSLAVDAVARKPLQFGQVFETIVRLLQR